LLKGDSGIGVYVLLWELFWCATLSTLVDINIKFCMLFATVRAYFIALFILLVVSSSFAQEREEKKYELVPKYTLGESCRIKCTVDFSATIAIKDDGDKRKELYKAVIVKEFDERLIEVDKEGLPKKFKIKCLTVKRKEETTPVRQKQEKPKLKGHVFFFERKKVKGKHRWQIVAKEAYIDPITYSEIGYWHMYDKLLPEGKVKTGDTWKIKAEDIVALWDKPLAANAKCKLKKVEGKKATIQIKIQEKFKSLQLDVNGELVFDLETGKPVYSHFEGKLTFNLNISPKAGFKITLTIKRMDTEYQYK
jgi:hypothetical protein